MKIRKLNDGRVVAVFHAKELLAFVRAFVEQGLGEVPLKLVLQINGIDEHMLGLEEKEITRWPNQKIQ
jgi:hypothetical protein